MQGSQTACRINQGTQPTEQRIKEWRASCLERELARHKGGLNFRIICKESPAQISHKIILKPSDPVIVES